MGFYFYVRYYLAEVFSKESEGSGPSIIRCLFIVAATVIAEEPVPGTFIDVELAIFAGRFESFFNFVDMSRGYPSIVFPKEANDRTGHI